MRICDLRVPSDDGALLCDPPCESWATMLAANRESLGRSGQAVAHVPLGEARSRARAELVALARSYTARLERTSRDGAADAPVLPDAPVAVTGHQPMLFHPGVWVKHLLVADLAGRTGGVALNLVVDSDSADGLCADFPSRAAGGAPVVGSECLFAGSLEPAYESLEVPSLGALEAWASRIETGTEASGVERAVEAFRRWRADLTDVARRSASLGAGRIPVTDIMVAVRRAHERSLGLRYLDLCVSELAASDAFLRFALDLCGRAETLLDAYDRALADYRKARGIKNPANPFPDLKAEAGAHELPLWILTRDGARSSLVVERRGDECLLFAGDAQVTAIPLGGPDAGVDALRAAGVSLRPKAVALTLFARLLLADFFLHGVGGGKYDAVTDAVIRDVYGIEPPRYAVASMTLLVGFPTPPDPAPDIARLERRLSAFAHNPDRLLHGSEDVGPEASALVARKRELVQAIAQPGAEKKALGAEIREVNERLRVHAASAVEQAQAELVRLRAAADTVEIAAYREFAYCFFTPEGMRDALEAALASMAGTRTRPSEVER